MVESGSGVNRGKYCTGLRHHFQMSDYEEGVVHSILYKREVVTTHKLL